MVSKALQANICAREGAQREEHTVAGLAVCSVANAARARETAQRVGARLSAPAVACRALVNVWIDAK